VRAIAQRLEEYGDFRVRRLAPRNPANAGDSSEITVGNNSITSKNAKDMNNTKEYRNYT
jgi:hypothetical protein